MTTMEQKTGFDLKAGLKEYFTLGLGEQANGQPNLLPVITISGVSEGPTIFLNACMHGDETLGADVLRRVAHDLQPNEMRGNVVIVPVANLGAQATRTRRNTMELYPGPHDMNRVFPGSADGVMSERLANLIDQRFSAIADYIFDVHCASVGGSWQPYATAPPLSACPDAETQQKTLDFAVAFGAPLVLVDYLFAGSLVDPALKRGGVASMAEFGIANQTSTADREFGIAGVRRLLEHTGIVESVSAPLDPPLMISEFARVKSDRGGYLELFVSLGDDVEQGQEIGRVEDLERNVLQVFTAPAAGRVCRLNTMGVAGTGDNIAFIGVSKGSEG